jgi:hypothetical protein
LQGPLLRDWKCTDYEPIYLLEGEAQENSRIFTETSFFVFEKMEEILDYEIEAEVCKSVNLVG